MAGETGKFGRAPPPTLKKRHVPLDKRRSKNYISAQVSSLRKSGQLRRRAIDAWAAGMYF